MRSQLKRLLMVVTGEDDLDRACEAIPDEECPRTRAGNFLLNLGNGACTKTAEQMAGPNLVLPYLLGIIGAPVFWVGWLMPVKQAGSLLPQMAVAARIRVHERRKFFWVVSGLVQTLCLLLMVPAVLYLPPAVAGGCVVLLLALFSLASGTASVAYQDVLGKTVSKGRRGQLLALRATVGGGATLILGVWLRQLPPEQQNLALFLGLLVCAALLWAAGSGLFALIREPAGATGGARNALSEARHGWQLLRQKPGFRLYLAVRILLLFIELAAPFYVLYSQKLFGNGGMAGGLGTLVIATGLAQLLSNPFWGRFADTSSRKVMLYSALLAIVSLVLALGLSLFPHGGLQMGLFGAAFLVLALAEAGVRLGRKTYLVDAAPEEDRPTYVAFSNTLVGIITLLAGTLGLLAQAAGSGAVLMFIMVSCLLASLALWRLPEAEQLL